MPQCNLAVELPQKLLRGVTTKRLNEQVRRNADRFPEDFVFRLTNQELASLRSQIAILKTGRGQHRKYPPLAFTEHGAVMAATILNSPRAANMSVYIVRAFVRLRTMLEGNVQLARKLDELERSRALNIVVPPVGPEGVVDIFAAAGLEKPDLSILSPVRLPAGPAGEGDAARRAA